MVNGADAVARLDNWLVCGHDGQRMRFAAIGLVLARPAPWTYGHANPCWRCARMWLRRRVRALHGVAERLRAWGRTEARHRAGRRAGVGGHVGDARLAKAFFLLTSRGPGACWLAHPLPLPMPAPITTMLMTVPMRSSRRSSTSTSTSTSTCTARQQQQHRAGSSTASSCSS